MPTQSAAPTGVPAAGAGMGAGAPAPGAVPGVLGDFGVGAGMDPAAATGGGMGGLGTAIKGMQNMLGKDPEEREKNAKALAAAVKDIGGLVGTLGETTLMKRMMEAQSSGLGFIEPSGGGPALTPPGGTSGGAMAPIMSGMGYK